MHRLFYSYIFDGDIPASKRIRYIFMVLLISQFNGMLAYFLIFTGRSDIWAFWLIFPVVFGMCVRPINSVKRSRIKLNLIIVGDKSSRWFLRYFSESVTYGKMKAARFETKSLICSGSSTFLDENDETILVCKSSCYSPYCHCEGLAIRIANRSIE